MSLNFHQLIILPNNGKLIYFNANSEYSTLGIQNINNLDFFIFRAILDFLLPFLNRGRLKS